MLEHFNATHFPYRVEMVENQLVLFELLLNDITEDLDLKDVPKRKLITIGGNNFEEMWKTFTNIKFDYK